MAKNERVDVKIRLDTKIYLEDLKKDMDAPSIDAVIKSVLGLKKKLR